MFVATRSVSERARALKLGAAWVGGYEDPPPALLDAAVTFAPAGAVVVDALRGLRRGGAVAINAIHLDKVPEFPYELLWWERSLRSVANFTRADAREFLSLASTIPIETRAELIPLRRVNEALRRLKAGDVENGTLVIVP